MAEFFSVLFLIGLGMVIIFIFSLIFYLIYYLLKKYTKLKNEPLVFVTFLMGGMLMAAVGYIGLWVLC